MTTHTIEHEIDLSPATLHSHEPLPPNRPGRVEYRDGGPAGRGRLVFLEEVQVGPASLPHVRVEVLDRDAWRQIDPLEVLEYPAWVPGTEPRELRTLARVAPCDAKPAGDGPGMPLAVYELLVAEHGHDDDGAESSPEHVQAGAAAMRPALVLAGAWRSDPLRDFRGEIEPLLRTAEAIGRHYGMPAEEIAQRTGRPFTPRRSLFPPMVKARELDEQLAVARARAEEQARAVQVVAVEEQRPRTFRELHIDAVAVAADRFGSVAPEPFRGARLLAIMKRGERVEHVYGWRAVAFAPLPRFEKDGVRNASDEIAPAQAASFGAVFAPPPMTEAAHDPDLAAIAFLKACIADFGGDMGAVRGFTIDVQPTARELAAAWARTLLKGPVPSSWRLDWLAEVLVRSEIGRLRPDVATAVILEAMDECFRALPEHRSFTVPRGHGAMRERVLADTDMARPEDATQTIEMFTADDLPSRRSRSVVGAAAAHAAKAGFYVRVGGTAELEELKPAKRAKR